MPEFPGDTSFSKRMSWWVIFSFSFLTYARLSCVKFNNSKWWWSVLCLYRSYGKVSHLNYQKTEKNYGFTCFNLLVELSFSGKSLKKFGPRYYIMIIIQDIIPFLKLTGDHFVGNLGIISELGIISGSRDHFGGSKIARKWYSLALSSLPRSMIPGGTIRSYTSLGSLLLL